MTPSTLPEPTYSNPLAGCYFDGYTSDQMQAAFAAGAASRDAEVEALRADAALLDYLQTHGATVSLVCGDPWAFMVGGYAGRTNADLREAINSATAAEGKTP